MTKHQCADLLEAVAAAERFFADPLSSPDPVPLPVDVVDFAALRRLRDKFGLDATEASLLFLLAAQEVSSGRPSPLPKIGCWSDLTQISPQLPDPRGLLAHHPLRRWGLVEPIASRIAPLPLTQRPLRISERIVAFLLGDNTPDPRLAAALQLDAPLPVLTPLQHRCAMEVASLWQSTPHFGAFTKIALLHKDAGTRFAVAWEAAAQAGLSVARLHARDLPEGTEERQEWIRRWEIEALLGDRSLYLDTAGLNESAARAAADWVSQAGGAAILGHARPMDLGSSWRTVKIPATRPEDRRQLVSAVLEGKKLEDPYFPQRVASQFNLEATTLYQACNDALIQAEGNPSTTVTQTLWQACREHARPRLGALAQTIHSTVGWNDLVLPAEQLALLRDAVGQVREQARVHHDWGFAAKSERGLNLTALLSGPSGTGKTLAAEVMANHLQLDLLRVDLSAVVSKYIGETEEHLNQIFDAAESGGAVLLFDEADALFGPRSKVSDSRDRHANIEVSFLLQRLECFRGLALLTTNFKENLDQAFLRRIRFHVDFPFPDRLTRQRIWQQAFPPAAPVDGLDFERLSRLSLTGGSIRNIALNAAFYAAPNNQPITNHHIADAAHSEFRKAEKPVPERELQALREASR